MESDSRIRQGSDPMVRRFEEAEPPMVVLDFGPETDALSADVVDDTLIVVDEASGEQHEYSLPAEHRRTFMRNGVLTIEVEA